MNKDQVDYAIKELGAQWASQMYFKPTESSIAVVAAKVSAQFGISLDEATAVTKAAFDHWVTIYYPE